MFRALGVASSPDLRWKTIETDRFSFHYHEGEETVIPHVANVAQSILPVLEKDIGWTVAGKIQLVLIDDYDLANGWATPFPNNATSIFLPAPEPDSSLSDYDDWARLVVTHELTHIVHLDMARGLPRGLRALFGRTPIGFFPLFPTTFPNLSQPAWLIEGYGVFMETKYTSGGRGRSSYFDMMLRCAALEGRLSTLGQLSDWQTTWPGGTLRYLYGASLYEFMANNIRGSFPSKIAEENSKLLYPQFHINSAPQSMGFTYQTIYERWKKKLMARYQAQEKTIRETPLTQSRPLTFLGHQIGKPSFSPDGRRIAYVEQTPDNMGLVRVMDADGKNSIVAARGWVRSGPTWSPDSASLVFALLDFKGTYSLKSDLYRFDLSNRKMKRLTVGARAVDPSWSPDGKSLIYARLNTGSMDLMVFDLTAKRSTVLFSFAESEQVATPHWSPDGSSVLFNLWRPGGKWDICVLRMSDRALDLITDDRAIDIAPAWSADGAWIFFSSDRTGVSNMFAYSTATKELFQVSNVLGGVFDPAPSPDGTSLVFANYTSRGFDLHQMDFREAALTPAVSYVDNHPPLPVKEPIVALSESKPYNPFPTVLPQFWTPNLMGGLTTAGQDVLAKHYYYASTFLGSDYQVQYVNQQLFPYFEFDHWDFQDSSYRVGLPEKGYSARLIVPLFRVLRSQLISIGFQKQEINSAKALRQNNRLPEAALWRTKGYEVEWEFSNAKTYGRSVAPENGRQLSASYFYQGKPSGEPVEVHNRQAQWTEFLPGFAPHHVLILGAGAGASNRLSIDSQESELFAARLKRQVRASFQKEFHRFEPSLLPIAKPDDGFFQKTTTLQAAYAFPLATIENAPGTGFYFLDRLRGRVFSYGDRFSSDNASPSTTRLFTGAEVASDWGLSYFLPLSISLFTERQISTSAKWHTGVRVEFSREF